MALHQNMVIPGLESSTATIPAAGNFMLIATLQSPKVSQGASANSQVVVVVKQNGTTMYTSQAGVSGFKIPLVCAAGDQIQVTLSSSAPVDQPLNAIQCTVAIG